MSDEATCVLDPAQRRAMRADLLEIQLRNIDNVCKGCLGAFWANLPDSFRNTDEVKMRRREEMARRRE